MKVQKFRLFKAKNEEFWIDCKTVKNPIEFTVIRNIDGKLVHYRDYFVDINYAKMLTSDNEIRIVGKIPFWDNLDNFAREYNTHIGIRQIIFQYDKYFGCFIVKFIDSDESVLDEVCVSDITNTKKVSTNLSEFIKILTKYMDGKIK